MPKMSFGSSVFTPEADDELRRRWRRRRPERRRRRPRQRSPGAAAGLHLSSVTAPAAPGRPQLTGLGGEPVIKSLPKTALASVLVRGVGRQRGALLGWYWPSVGVPGTRPPGPARSALFISFTLVAESCSDFRFDAFETQRRMRRPASVPMCRSARSEPMMLPLEERLMDAARDVCLRLSDQLTDCHSFQRLSETVERAAESQGETKPGVAGQPRKPRESREPREPRWPCEPR